MRAAMLLAFVAGCVDVANIYTCDTDADCVLEGVQGRCEPTAHCSFADATCGGQGFRYHEYAGESADACIVSGEQPSEVDAFDLAGEDDSTRTSCGDEGARDAYIEITSSLSQVLFIDTAVAGTNAPVAIALRSGACPGTTELGCTKYQCEDLPYSYLATQVEPGTYCIVVEQAKPDSAATVGLRVLPSHRVAQPFSPTSPFRATTCNQPNYQAALIFATCPGGTQFTTMVDPDDLDIAISLRTTSPDGPLVVNPTNDAQNALPESFTVALPDPGLYWLFVDRVSGPTCGDLTVGFSYAP